MSGSKGETSVAPDAIAALISESQKSAKPPTPVTVKTAVDDGKKQPAKPAARKRRKTRSTEAEDGDEDNNDEDEVDLEDGADEEEQGTKRGRGGRGRAARGGGARAPRASASEAKMLRKEMEFLERQLKSREQDVARLERDIAKLEKQLSDERSESKRFYQQVDGHKTSMMADLTYHMAKSHHSAMQTLQAAQHTNAQVMASAFGQSILRLKDKGNRLKELMPPMPDLNLPNARQIYHEQVAAFLNRTVTRMDEGEALLKKIDTAIADTQQTIEDERKRISPSLSPNELADLQKTLMEEQTRIAALKYERDMLAAGLEKKKTATPSPNPTPTLNGNPNPNPNLIPNATAALGAAAVTIPAQPSVVDAARVHQSQPQAAVPSKK